MWGPAFDGALLWCFKVLLQFSNWTFFIDLCWILTDHFKKGGLLHCVSLLWLYPSIERKWDSLRQLSQWLNGSTTERTANGTDFSESTVARQTNEADDCIPIIAFYDFETEKYSIVPFRGASPLKIEQAEHFRQNLPSHTKISLVILLTVCHTTFIDASSENFVLNQLMIP